MTELRHLLDLRNAASGLGSACTPAMPSSALRQLQAHVRAPLPGHALQWLDTANARTGIPLDTDSDDGWGSDFDDDELTPPERNWCLDRFDWEDRQMAGRTGEPPPVPPRLPAQ
jgi:hypothetical protein